MDIAVGKNWIYKVGISEYWVGIYSYLLVLPYLLDSFLLNEPMIHCY